MEKPVKQVKLFLALNGYVLGNADYDAMEVSIFSQSAGKGVLEDLILSGKDIHCYTLVAICREFKKEGMISFYKKYIIINKARYFLYFIQI